MILVEQAPQRTTSVVTRGRNWARGVQISGAVIAIAAVIMVGLSWAQQRGAASPAEVTRQFLQSTSCSKLYDLATDAGDRLLGEGGCESMTLAAQGDRTYAGAQAGQFTRTLRFGDPRVQGRSARVTVDVSYADAAAPEKLVVVLAKVGHEWQVDSWGLPAS